MKRPTTDGTGPPATVSVLNLGCPKNQVDAEVMLGQLRAARDTRWPMRPNGRTSWS